MEVRKIMTKNPACCTPDSTLQEVAHMMEMYDCGCIPVINNHQEKHPIGTITDRDITIRTFAANKNPVEMTAADIMTTDIVTVTPDTSITECLKVMENRQIRRVLVTDKSGKCAGIVAQADLAEHVTDADKTANFVREVSESESDRSQENSYQSNRLEFSEERNRQNNRYFSGNQTLNKSRSKKHKKFVQKESFFSGTNLLTLLGSIALGAGIKYYLGPETEDAPVNKHKIKTGEFDTKITAGNKTAASSAQTPSSSEPVHVIEIIDNRDKITGTVDSFDTIKGDDDFGSTTEIGRTASNN